MHAIERQGRSIFKRSVTLASNDRNLKAKNIKMRPKTCGFPVHAKTYI